MRQRLHVTTPSPPLSVFASEMLLERLRCGVVVKRDDVEHFLTEQKASVNEQARKFSSFLYDALTNENVPGEFRHYLIM